MDQVNRLNFLFGNEETVRRRRELVILREKIGTLLRQNKHEQSVICSGSLGEGVAYPHSDDDIMYVKIRPSMQVYEGSDDAIISHGLHMIPSPYSPGFCFIQGTQLSDVGFTLIKSKDFREDFAQRWPDSNLHGPCASRTVGLMEYDMALCLSCPSWPTMANEWLIRRRRYGWPSRELLENIVRSGCHLVPIGNPDSPLHDFEWRVSFSLAERSLIHKFSHVQFLIYNLLKLILKGVINNRVPNILCSYFVKTTIFYTIENTSSLLWANNGINECYMKCLLILYHFIEAKNCPNYFVPDNNMMKRKVNESNKQPLLSIVSELMTRGIAGALLLCDKESVVMPSSISYARTEFDNDNGLLNGYLLGALIRAYKEFIHEKYRIDYLYGNVKYMLSPLVSCNQLDIDIRSSDSSFINLIIKHMFTLLGLRSIQLSATVTERNKFRYQMLNCGEAMLHLGCSTDVCSGRLHLANYMFMTGSFRKCLMIIQTVFSKFAPYVIHHTDRKQPAQEMYIEVMCNKDYSLQYKVRKAWALDVEFSCDTVEFAPPFITILSVLLKYANYRGCGSYVSVHPLCFAYYLQGMCFYQTGDYESMNISVTLLENVVRDLPEKYLHSIVFGRYLISYMKMLQMDYQYSCRCITSTYFIMKFLDKKIKFAFSVHVQTCIFLLTCLLNRAFGTR